VKFAIVLPFAVCLLAQDPSQAPRFDVRSRLVLVPVNVLDAKGRTVTGLESSDFVVLDNHRPQKPAVDTIDTGVAPVALVIAIQSSGISVPALEKIRKIGSMIQPLITGEFGCAAVLSFARTITWRHEECSHDGDEIRTAIARVDALTKAAEENEACMLDAVHAAVERLRKVQNVRRVLLLISESRDRGSETALEGAIIEAQKAGVAVYAVTYSAFKSAFLSKAPVSAPRRGPPTTPANDPGNPVSINGMPPGRNNPFPKQQPMERQVDALGAMRELIRLGKVNTTEALAKTTGGARYSFLKQNSLEQAIEALGAALHTQYVLSFVPDDLTPGYHQIQVRLKTEADVTIRARPGYWPNE
jgi:VWFA-related protein